MRRSPERERGSTLLLFPAAILIVFALAAITVDSAIAFMAQRQLLNAATAAANDAATGALSDTAFYRSDRIELTPAAAQAIADRVFAVVDPARHHGLAVTAEVTPAGGGCAWTVVVKASSRVDKLFGRALPGSSGQFAVHAQARASPRQAAGGC